MGAKKERGRFSLRFNISDPVQRAAVELLELQPPHSKSQYIANALTYYDAHFAENPQPLRVQGIDRVAIETIVRDIMRQESQGKKHLDTQREVIPVPETTKAPASQEQMLAPEYTAELGGSLKVDQATRDLISSTMAAFRRK